MSHEIHNHDNMVSALKTPWHRLGTVTDHLLTPKEAFTIAADWSVEKHPAIARLREDASWESMISELVMAHTENPEMTFSQLLTAVGYDAPIDDKHAIVRSDINYPLGVVGNDYTPVTNKAAFDFIEAVGDNMLIETAGSLKNGRRVWALAKMDRALDLAGDELLPYLLFLWAHDGTSALRVLATPVRVVCDNTLRMAISGAQDAWSAPHTASVHDRIAEAKETLRLGRAFYDNFEVEVNRMIEQTVSDLEFETILENVVPDPTPEKTTGKVSDRKLNNAIEKRGELRKLYHLDPRVGDFKGTGWGVYQAFSTFDLWGGRVHGGEDNRLSRQADRILAGDTLTRSKLIQDQLAAIGA